MGSASIWTPLGLAEQRRARGTRSALTARTGQAAGLTAGLGIGVAAAVAGAVGVGFFSYGTIGSAVLIGAILAVVCGTVFTFAGGLLWAAAWRRYAAFLTCTRGRLPWRLGRFLDWAYDAGLLRISGTAYQFRHLELQDHLASGPATPKPSPQFELPALANLARDAED